MTLFGVMPASAEGSAERPRRAFRMALPKGALFGESLDVLERTGLDVAALRDPGRQLIVASGDMEYVIARPTDIPTYVAYGGADAGIVGKDVLLEAGEDVVEMVDLVFGGCRFVVAEPRGRRTDTRESYRHLGVLRVATKYPRVAESHFASRGVQVELVKLHGNIELAPLIGLSDQIVDIVSTGRTLAENDLEVVEVIRESSARFIANPVGLKTESERVTALAERLAEATRGMTDA